MKYRYKCINDKFFYWDEDYIEGILDDIKTYKFIKPIFKREGWYLRKPDNLCWTEFLYQNHYHAVLIDNKSFEYKLSILNHKPLTLREIYLRKALLVYGKNKQIKRKLALDTAWKTLRDIIMNRYRYV